MTGILSFLLGTGMGTGVLADGLVKIPDVVGLQKAEAVKKLDGEGLNVNVTMDSSSSEPVDTVISQDAAAGSEAAVGSSITITVSAGTGSGSGLSMTGGWTYNQGDPSLDADENASVRAIFDEAVKDLEEVQYEPQAYLGSQNATENIYCVLCRTQAEGADREYLYVLMYLHEDRDGKGEILNTVELDLGDFVQYQAEAE